MRKTSNGITFEQWSVLLVPFPFSDLSGTKRRPALVVSNTRFNQAHDDIACCLITSITTAEEGCPLVSTKDLESGFLPFESKIKPYRIFTMEKSVVLKQIGLLGARKSQEVKRELLKLFT